MSEVSSNQKNTNNAATNTGEAPRERGFVRPSRPMAPPKRGAVKKKIWEDFTGKPSASNPPTDFGIWCACNRQLAFTKRMLLW
ncbi:hypothetical protein D5086_026677 [Populus alba]|uniref:Uncharacterized protein n=1 Tax=Populus alba TaxID=43335 RepID=A0ACC4B2J8_POPAL